MKEKTSVTLSRDLLKKIDRLANREHSRSAVIEHMLREYLRQLERAEIHLRDLEILNRAAQRLNKEAHDTFLYQADPWRSEME